MTAVQQEVEHGVWVEPASRHCPSFQATVELVGRRWSGAIILAASHGCTRYSDFLATVPKLSERLLSQRLRELEAAQLLARTVIPTTPVQVRYELTERGRELAEAVQPLVRWGERWIPSDDDHV
jgi:DNA-binding HxlR family transcriptional regulator